jgi:hypothetical protein
LKIQRLTLTAMFAALCGVGGLIKIPFGIGTAALDSVPALVSAAFLPPVFAGFAALIGHIASAMYVGFPLGPFHVIIALEMLIIVAAFTYLHRAGRNVWKWILFIIGNGLLAPLPFYYLISPAFVIAALPPIFIATIVNAIIAALVMPALRRFIKSRVGESC